MRVLQPFRRALTVLVCLAAVAAERSYYTEASADEPPPKFTAAQLLSPGELRGPHHAVAAAVRAEGCCHRFSITSHFGPFEAAGRTMLAARLPETVAAAPRENAIHGAADGLVGRGRRHT